MFNDMYMCQLLPVATLRPVTGAREQGTTMKMLDLSGGTGRPVGKADGRLAAVVLTALELEYRAVREHLTELQVWEHPAGTLFEVGTIRGTTVRIAAAIAGEGNQSSAVVSERACGAFSPRMLLLVGVAGALHPEVELGDVVVATRIYAYQGGKEDSSGFLVRPRAWDAPHHLEQRARYLTRTSWWRRLLPDINNCGFGIHFKPVLAGEVVFDSPGSSLAELAHRHYNDAVAVEMESAGVSLAARLNRALPVLTIRGISDRADGAKATCDSAGWPVVAAARAAAFALTLVASAENHAAAMLPDLTVTSIPLVRRPTKIAVGRAVAASRSPETWQRHAFVDHDRLFGADRLIENVRHALTSQTGQEVVSLFGEGGAGKTAIAYSAVAEAVAGGAFSRVAWLSAAGRASALGSTVQRGNTFGGPDVLREMSVQLGFDLGGNRAVRPEQFAGMMGSLRPDERVLGVIDGLEAVQDAAAVVHDLRRMGLVRPHKLLVTTRWQLRAETLDANELRLWPLADADAIALIRHAGAEDRLLRSINGSALQPVVEVTQGNPFLLKLVVDQYLSSHLPLDVVLDSLRGTGSGDGVSGNPLTGLVRAHLYGRSLSELKHRFGEHATKALLNSFCSQGRNRSLRYEELASALGTHAGVSFPAILVDACRLALVTASGDRTPDGAHRVYAIHNLLHEPTCDCRVPC